MEHIERHNVEPVEVEEVFVGSYLTRRSHSGRYLVLGRTWGGRHLVVVVEKLAGGVLRVITARDMDETERRIYSRRGK